MKLAILDSNAVNPAGDVSWDSFKKYADLTIFKFTSEAETLEHIGDSDAILLNKVEITPDIIDQVSSHLRYIGILATGSNVVDVPYAASHGITVTNVPDYSTYAVAQHVFALILQFTNEVSVHNRSVKLGGWLAKDCFCYWNVPLHELHGKTLGILGYGNIGRRVEKIGRAFGMHVLVTPHKIESRFRPFVPLRTMLSLSDFITLHTPLTSETHHIINSDTLGLVKKTAILINTSRGGVVNEADVVRALRNETLAGFATDVLEIEPMTEDCPLRTAPNCIITPHNAWSPLETRERLLEVALSNFASYLKGSPQNIVSQDS